MRTFTAQATVAAAPEAILDALCDPEACATWAPVPFVVEGLSGARLRTGSRARVSGRIVGRCVDFEVAVQEATGRRLALTADGAVALDVAYDVVAAPEGSAVRASVGVRPGPGVTGRVVASATDALLSAGALDHAVARLAGHAQQRTPVLAGAR